MSKITLSLANLCSLLEIKPTPIRMIFFSIIQILFINVLIHGAVLQDGKDQDLAPRPAAAAMIGAFSQYPIVALGDAHDCSQLYQFITRLVSDAKFAETVNDIVVEFGNAKYQDVMDRYTSGEDVPLAQLQQVWRNTTQMIVWDSPVYEQFFSTIRKVNAALPKTKQIRVILGDPPIDWRQTNTFQEWGHWLSRRDEYFANTIETEVLSKRRKALLIIGGAHLVRGIDEQDVTARIESQHPHSMFIVMTHTGFGDREADLESHLQNCPVNSLLRLEGTWLGQLSPALRWPQLKIVKLRATSLPPRLQDVADAWLYVGPRESLTESIPFPGIYRDEYWDELNRRNNIMWKRALEPDDFNLDGKWID